MYTQIKTLKLVFLIAIGMLSISNTFAQQGEDVVILKNGIEYSGVIIEQMPGKSIKLTVLPSNDTLVFYMNQIEKIKKNTKKTEVQPAVETESKKQTEPTNNNYSQNSTYQVGNDLTIYSEQGYKFALYINGKRFNKEFLSSVTAENINHNWVKVGVLFEDPDKGLIETDLPLSSNFDYGLIPYTNTYRITANNKNILKLKLFDYGAKKLAPGSSNVIIHQSTAPNGLNFQIYQRTRIGN